MPDKSVTGNPLAKALARITELELQLADATRQEGDCEQDRDGSEEDRSVLEVRAAAAEDKLGVCLERVRMLEFCYTRAARVAWSAESLYWMRRTEAEYTKQLGRCPWCGESLENEKHGGKWCRPE